MWQALHHVLMEVRCSTPLFFAFSRVMVALQFPYGPATPLVTALPTSHVSPVPLSHRHRHEQKTDLCSYTLKRAK